MRKILVYILFGSIFFLSTVSGRNLPIRYGDLIGKYPLFDELIHIITFTILFVSLKLFIKLDKRSSLIICLVFALVTELWQGVFSQQRSFSLSDLLCNIIGIWVALSLCDLFSSKNECLNKNIGDKKG